MTARRDDAAYGGAVVRKPKETVTGERGQRRRLELCGARVPTRSPGHHNAAFIEVFCAVWDSDRVMEEELVNIVGWRMF